MLAVRKKSGKAECVVPLYTSNYFVRLKEIHGVDISVYIFANSILVG